MLFNQLLNAKCKAHCHLASWCNGQENVCLTLCSKAVNNNTCDPVSCLFVGPSLCTQADKSHHQTTLTYNCLCTSNNSSPDLAAYMNSLPYYICEQSYADCVTNNPNN